MYSRAFLQASLFVGVFSLCSAISVKYNETDKDSSLNFLVLADWGGQPNNPFTTPDEVLVGKQMGLIAKTTNAKFVLALGDNFYYDGVKDASDPRFKYTFENVFTADSLQIPWYVIAGNHDHHGNVSGQIAYSSISKRWNFPSEYYSINFTIPGTNKTVAFVMIDTVLLCGVTYDYLSDPPFGPVDVADAEKQWKWIEAQLQALVKFDYVFVAGHYPVWSIAEHGPTTCLVNRLRGMLIKYNVNAYLCGHDHNLQHVRETNVTVDYLVIGAAHFVDRSLAHKDDIPDDWVRFHNGDPSSMGGFAYFEASGDQISVTYANGAAGKDLYHLEILPRKCN